MELEPEEYGKRGETYVHSNGKLFTKILLATLIVCAPVIQAPTTIPLMFWGSVKQKRRRNPMEQPTECSKVETYGKGAHVRLNQIRTGQDMLTKQTDKNFEQDAADSPSESPPGKSRLTPRPLPPLDILPCSSLSPSPKLRPSPLPHCISLIKEPSPDPCYKHTLTGRRHFAPWLAPPSPIFIEGTTQTTVDDFTDDFDSK